MTLQIETPDGSANAYFAHPSKGAHAAVLIWPDIVGLRPAFKMMAKRLAGDGYAALVVNPYYRSGQGPFVEPGQTFRITMFTAHERADRIRAGGSYHGGGLATDKDNSPHLLIPEMNADYLIAIAENDDERSPEDKTVLKAAFAATKNNAEIEVYEGTQHGWCPPDSAVYNEAMADKAWARTLALFERALA